MYQRGPVIFLPELWQVPSPLIRSKTTSSAEISLKTLVEQGRFEESLVLLNNEIASLACFHTSGPVFLHSLATSATIIVFPGSAQDEETQQKQKIYFQQLRNIEVERLVFQVKHCSNYREKLECLLKTPGFGFDSNLTVFTTADNDESIGLSASSSTIFPVIDLNPRGNEEVAVYNDLLQAYAEKKYKCEGGHQFSKNYGGFQFEIVKDQLITKLKTTGDQTKLLSIIKTDIEEAFGYQPIVSTNSRPQGKTGRPQIKIPLEIQHEFETVLLGGERMRTGPKSEQDILTDWHLKEIVRFYLLVQLAPKDIISIDKKRNENQERNENGKKNAQSLLDAWKTGADHYETVIKYLKRKYVKGSDFPLLLEKGGKIKWNNFRGSIQYLAAFISCCQSRDYIDDYYSGAKLINMLGKSFGVFCNSKPFQQGEISNVDKARVAVFSDMP